MIVLYTGRRGCGKSLTMVKDAYKFYQDGWTIYTNIKLKFPTHNINEEELIKINPSTKLNNCVLVIDEIQTLLDSRRSARGNNLNFSYFVQQIRKRNIVILATTQYIGTVDLRVREHTDILARPNFIKKLNLCEVKYIDMTAQETDEYNIWEDKNDYVEIVFNPVPIFELYDTNTLVKSVEQINKQKRKNKNT